MKGQIGCCLLLFCASLAWASPDCLEGEWQFDQEQSDSLQRVKDKLARQQKMKEKAAYRPARESEAKVNFPVGLPDFVFMAGRLLIGFAATDVVLKQGNIERRVNTAGKSPALSLKNLYSEDGATVAGWEDGVLAIDTTTQNFLIEERYELQSATNLKVVAHLVSGDTTLDVVKIYWRKSPILATCHTQVATPDGEK